MTALRKFPKAHQLGNLMWRNTSWCRPTENSHSSSVPARHSDMVALHSEKEQVEMEVALEVVLAEELVVVLAVGLEVALALGWEEALVVDLEWVSVVVAVPRWVAFQHPDRTSQMDRIHLWFVRIWHSPAHPSQCPNYS